MGWSIGYDKKWKRDIGYMVGRECACKKTEHLVVEGDFEHRPLE